MMTTTLFEQHEIPDCDCAMGDNTCKGMNNIQTEVLRELGMAFVEGCVY